MPNDGEKSLGGHFRAYKALPYLNQSFLYFNDFIHEFHMPSIYFA